MTLTLIRTSEPDGMWYKILRDGLTIKCWSCIKGKENLTHIEAELYFDNLVEASTVKIEIIKSVEI